MRRSYSQLHWLAGGNLRTFCLTYLFDVLSDILSDISSDILPGISPDVLSGILSDISFDILSDISSDILPGISPDILPGILSGISSDIMSDISCDILSDWSSLTFCLTFFLTYLLTFFVWHIFWHSFLTFYLAVEARQGTLSADGRGWGPAGNTGHSRSQLRPGREHWPHEGRGCGAAGNTGRGCSRWRSGREHWTQMVAVFAVQVRQRTMDTSARGWGLTARNRKEGKKEETTDIKSNSPHLTGVGTKKPKKHMLGSLSYHYWA